MPEMDPRLPPSEPMELVCEPCADYVPWKDDMTEIKVAWKLRNLVSWGGGGYPNAWGFAGIRGFFVDGGGVRAVW
jgi:hypothetical protein